MHDGLRPADHKLSAEELVALHANPDAHPNALDYELVRTTGEALMSLVRRECGADEALSSLAYAEVNRRADAYIRLIAANPSLARINR